MGSDKAKYTVVLNIDKSKFFRAAVMPLNATKVYVNVYDTSVPLVYHSTVEVYGIEYAYGGHRFENSGIHEKTPKDAKELSGEFKLK